jgi:hypothetical protein
MSAVGAQSVSLHAAKTGVSARSVYAFLTAATVLIWWIPRLFRGFWIDEAGAYWIAENGLAHVWERVHIFFPGQSLLYSYLTAFFTVGGPYKEAILRLPSIAGMLVAAWLLYRITERIVGPGSGFLAVVPFACTGAIIETATDARPYALGLAVILASFLSLYEWVHTRSNRWFIIYCACSSLVLYFHYLFGVVFVVQFIYLIAARRVPWVRFVFAGALIFAAATPLMPELAAVAHVSGMWKTAEAPTAVTFVRFFPVQVLGTALLGFLLYRVVHPEWMERFALPKADDTILLTTWLLLGPVLMFAASRTTGRAVFVTRYLIYALPPAFILLAWFLRRVRNEQAQIALVCGIALTTFLYIPALGGSDWRAALDVVRNEPGANTPVLVRSGFVESSDRDLSHEPNPASYLFAPLAIYPIPNPIIPVPFFVDAAMEQRLEAQASSYPRFCLLASDKADVLDSLPRWFHAHGYRSTTREVAGFTVLFFDRPPNGD